jgi:2-C-methyl-D-erythritol 4-phosphate cytidylyltransferase
MGTERPKQYLRIDGVTILEHVLGLLLREPLIKGVVVGLAEHDRWWPTLSVAGHPRLIRSVGGAERSHTVLNALGRLEGVAQAQDWVLVHDAARPCLLREDLHQLIAELDDEPVGGLLAVPVQDTMKRADGEHKVVATVSRAGLWHAQTPQMFRHGLLSAALQAALRSGARVTDDAEAMEMAGHRPRLIRGHADNIKITRPEDLRRARRILAERE